MSGPSDQWMQFYQQNSPTTFEQVSDNKGTVSTAGSTSSSSSPLNPEGRVAKPIRRRSRASKKTPTTLLSTDTTNFRAMVQQFTGGGGTTIPFSSGGASHYYTSIDNSATGSTTHVSFDRQPQPRTMGGLVSEGSGYNFTQIQQRPQPHLFSLNHNNGGTGPADQGYYQGFVGGTNTSNPNAEVYDPGAFDRSSQVHSRPSSYSSSNKLYNDNPYSY